MCLQYNYLENIPDALTATSNTFQVLSYIGSGNNGTDGRAKRCGCTACPSMPCGLARSGPAPGPLTRDSQALYNSAVNAKLEGCGGSSGSCMTVNGQSCCVAVFSYERPDTNAACASTCNNYWSSITRAKPLSALWLNVTWVLPPQ